MPEMEKHVENIKMAKFESPTIKEGDVMTVRIFKRKRKSCSKFSENSNCSINLLFYSRGLKLSRFGIFDALFPFLAFFKL